MTHYLQYWRLESAANNYEIAERTGNWGFNHSAGDQLGILRKGDVLWVVTIYDGHLLLSGRLEVDVVVDQVEAERILNDHNLWQAKYHAIAEPGTESNFTIIDISETAPKLRFRGSVDRLPPGFSGRNLQSLRTLSTESAVLLDADWSSHEESPTPPLIETPPATQRKAQRAQGYARHASKRRAVELQAMKTAVVYFTRLGYSVEDVSSHKPYDLICYKGRTEVFVEVKGTQSDGSTLTLTRNEVRIAQSEDIVTALYILHSVNVSQDGDVFRASGGIARLVDPWSPSNEHLTPNQYTYRVPQ